MHISIPTIRLDNNKVIMKRNTFIQLRFTFQKILEFGKSYLYVLLGRYYFQQLFQYSNLCRIGMLQTMNRTMPFSPCTDNTRLNDQNQISILMQKWFQLIKMCQCFFQCRSYRFLTHKIFFISKTQDCFLSQLSQPVKIYLHGLKFSIRQLFICQVSQIKIALRKRYTIRSILQRQSIQLQGRALFLSNKIDSRFQTKPAFGIIQSLTTIRIIHSNTPVMNYFLTISTTAHTCQAKHKQQTMSPIFHIHVSIFFQPSLYFSKITLTG